MSKTEISKKRPADHADGLISKRAKDRKHIVASSTASKPMTKKRKIEEGSAKSENFKSRKSAGPTDLKGNSTSYSQKTDETILGGQSSREAHAKQKALAAERRAAKPNADNIARTKKIWERLRIKSVVPKQERDELVEELFGIISGRVNDYVFKHDSVRVIQCALKYSTPEQKKQIARELQGNYRELAESKYAKFLIAKLVVGDDEIRDIVVPEFYGHVKRLMRHPEASWIVDDIYRGLATREQKARLLREWYGPEFVVFDSKKKENITANLSAILKESPEKKGPIMQHLKETTNQLVQKKTTGFTMLHDALLQYFLNTKPGTSEATEFLEMLRDDEEGDLFKNLAFTKSGSRVVCLALAYGSSKDRRTILKFFKTHIKLLSGDINGHLVLLAAYEVIDDTVMTSKAIFSELLSKDIGEEERQNEMLGQVTHLTARIPLLYLLSAEPPKWLVTEEDSRIMAEIREIRKETSKKENEVRRVELVKVISQSLLDLVATHAATLIESSFGCQFIAEVLLGTIGEKQAALMAIASLAKSDTENSAGLLDSPHAGRMLKNLVQGGCYDQATKQIVHADPPLQFHDLLYDDLSSVNDGLVSWARGPNSFAIVAMMEAPEFSHHIELEELLRKHKEDLDRPRSDDQVVSAGTKIILKKIGETDTSQNSSKPKKPKTKDHARKSR